MKIKQEKIITQSYKFTIEKNGQKIARAFLYIIKNDLHDDPFGLLEDVFVSQNY